MKKRKTILLVSLLSVFALGLSSLFVFLKHDSFNTNALTNECEYHHGNHYAAKAPTADEPGWQEFWACCDCQHQYIGSAPAGQWSDASASSMIGGVGAGHVAYLPPTSYSSKLKTAVFADIQLCYKENSSPAGTYKGNAGSTAHAYLSLRNHFQLCKENNVDVIFMNGDIVNNAVEKYYELFDQTLADVYGNDESQYPEFVFNMGNHEWWDINSHETSVAVTMFKQHARINTPNLVRTSNVPFYLNNEETVPSYYKVINGVPFLAVSGENSDGLIGDSLKAELASWLEEIALLPSVQAGGPIYVAYHYALSTSLTHGNGSLPKCAALEEVLEDYPQAIVFTGDTHYSGVNERAINQVDFTTINIGSSSYSRMDKMSATMSGDEHFYNMQINGGKTTDIMTGNSQYQFEYTPTIHFMETMTDESTIIDRYFSADDVDDAVKLNGTWIIPAHSSPANFEYTNDRFENISYAHKTYGANGVSWPNDAEVTFGVNNGQMTVKFPDTNEYHYTEHFKIDVTGATAKTYDVVSRYYLYSPARENLYFVLEDLPAIGSGYSVKVTAYDYFDNPSLNYLISSTNNPNLSVDPIDNAFSLTYCDISSRVNLEEFVPGSHSSVEYYYNGVMEFRSGITLGRLLCDDGTTASASDYISLGNQEDVKPIVTLKVKNLSSDVLTLGLTVVKPGSPSDTWYDFSASTRQEVQGNSAWTTLTWDLTELFNLVGRSDLKQVGIKAKSAGYDDEGYKIHFLIDDIDLAAGEAIDRHRGDMFESGVNYNKDLTPIPVSAGSMTIDICFTSGAGTYINIMIGNGWQDWYGYYEVNSNGSLSGSYNGVSISTLQDGYYRLTFNFAEIDKLGGGSAENIDQITLVFIRGAWSTASGYIDINSNEPAQVVRGSQFTADGGFTKDITAVQLTETFVADIKFTTGSDTYLNIMLGDGWSNYFGYYQVNANGTLGGTYAGTSITILPDGYFRVSFVLSELNKVGGGSIENINKINLVYIRSAYTTGSGYIDLNPSI